jgi:hypothetical protein
VSDICTRAIANRIGSLVPLVKRSKRTAQGTLEDEILDDHVLKELLDRPHRNFTRQQLLRLTAQSIVTVGEAYWLKITNALRLPAELQPMPAQYVQPIVRGGYVEQYQIRHGDGTYSFLDYRDVIRFWFPDPETLYLSEGYLGPNAVNTDAARFASEHLRSFYQNDATPTTMLQAGVDAVSPSEDQWVRYIEDWLRKNNRRTGQKLGAPVMIPAGWEAIFAAIQSGADITPLLEFWQVNQLMNFGVPASVLGRVMSGDRSSAETNAYVFDEHTIKPIAQMISDTLSLSLAPEYDKDLFVEFDEFVAEDKDYTLRRETQDLTLKVRSVQQVLADREMDPEDAPWGEFPVGGFGDVPYTGEERENPFDLQPDDPDAIGGGGGMPMDEDMDEPEDEDEDEPRSRALTVEAEQHRIVLRERKFRPPMERAIRSVFEAQRREVIKRVRSVYPRARAVTVADLLDPTGWGELFDLKALAVLEKAYLFAATEQLALLGVSTEFKYTPTIKDSLKHQGAEMIKFVNETTKARLTDKIQSVLSTGAEEGWATKQISQELERAVNELFATRRHNAGTIARTELHRASINAQLETFKIANVPWKRWVDQRDNKVRDEHHASEILPVKRDELFIVGGYPARGPGDRSLPPHLSINCRCGVLAVFRDPTGVEKS